MDSAQDEEMKEKDDEKEDPVEEDKNEKEEEEDKDDTNKHGVVDVKATDRADRQIDEWENTVPAEQATQRDTDGTVT